MLFQIKQQGNSVEKASLNVYFWCKSDDFDYLRSRKMKKKNSSLLGAAHAAYAAYILHRIPMSF